VKNSPTLGTSNSYVASTLRKGFPSYLCKLHTQHPSWLYRCKYFRINQVKGQLGFPQKTKSPSGATAGGIPPPNGPIFCKNSQARQVRLDLSLGQIQAGREQPSGKDARAGDSLRLREDMALLPRLWTSGPLVESNLPSPNSTRQRKTERSNQRNKKHHINSQAVLNKQLFITRPHGPNTNT
jgi:hypothetical protein